MFRNYRPWGQIDWLFDKSGINKPATFLGCLSTEPRCLESGVRVKEKVGADAVYNFFIINDPICNDKELVKQKIDQSRGSLEHEIQLSGTIEEFELLCPPLDFIDYVDEVVKDSDFVILDITCMPKRFFFLAVKKILDRKIDNFLVTYAKPEEYGKTGNLSGNPDNLEPLPFFSAAEPEKGGQSDTLVVSIGHSELGLVTAFEEKAPGLNLQVLFPFPPGPPSLEKNWRFMNSIHGLKFRNTPVDPIRVSASNLSDAFDHMINISSEQRKKLILAPFGPKPISMAMCLFAIKTGSEVVYTQPRSYNPEYSFGAGKNASGDSATYGYWIVMDQKNLFFDQAYYEE